MFGSQVFHENARFVWMSSEPMKICIQFLSFLSLNDGFPHPTLPRASEESIDREKKKCAFHGSCQRCSKSLKRSIRRRGQTTRWGMRISGILNLPIPARTLSSSPHMYFLGIHIIFTVGILLFSAGAEKV